jgi:hypothetical protein
MSALWTRIRSNVMKIKDGWVERAANARFDATLGLGAWQCANEVERNDELFETRIALEAVAPLIRAEVLEEAAKACEDVIADEGAELGGEYANGCDSCAQAVRALKEGE